MKDKAIIREIIFFLFAVAIVAILMYPKNQINSDEKKIVGIDIKGEVNAPGYYELEYGSRIKDAIIIAGGETEKADLSTVNLAMKLIDGEEITIHAKGSKGNLYFEVININTADMYNLCKLDGIGEATAADIVKYRAEKGNFKTIDEIKKVKGIGTQKFNKIKDKITVE